MPLLLWIALPWPAHEDLPARGGGGQGRLLEGGQEALLGCWPSYSGGTNGTENSMWGRGCVSASPRASARAASCRARLGMPAPPRPAPTTRCASRSWQYSMSAWSRLLHGMSMMTTSKGPSHCMGAWAHGTEGSSERPAKQARTPNIGMHKEGSCITTRLARSQAVAEQSRDRRGGSKRQIQEALSAPWPSACGRWPSS